MTERVAARPATPEEATAMRLGPGVPVVTVERVTRDQDGLPIELLRVAAAGDRTELVYDDLPLAPGS